MPAPTTVATRIIRASAPVGASSGSPALEERVLCCTTRIAHRAAPACPPSGGRHGRQGGPPIGGPSRLPSGRGPSGGLPCPATSTWRPRRRVDVGSPTWTARAGRWAPRRTPFGGAAGRASSRSACRTTARADHPNRSSSWPSRASGGTDARLAAPTSTATTPCAHGARAPRPGRRDRGVTVGTPGETARLVRPASRHRRPRRVRRPTDATEDVERLASGPSRGVTPTRLPASNPT